LANNIALAEVPVGYDCFLVITKQLQVMQLKHGQLALTLFSQLSAVVVRAS